MVGAGQAVDVGKAPALQKNQHQVARLAAFLGLIPVGQERILFMPAQAGQVVLELLVTEEGQGLALLLAGLAGVVNHREGAVEGQGRLLLPAGGEGVDGAQGLAGDHPAGAQEGQQQGQ